MKRETWIATQSFANGVMGMNALFCEYEDEKQITREDHKEIAVELSKKVTRMALEDSMDIIKATLAVMTPTPKG